MRPQTQQDLPLQKAESRLLARGANQSAATTTVAAAPTQTCLPLDPAGFFQALYGKDPPGFRNIFSLPGETSHFIRASLPVSASKKAIELAPDRNVYFGLGLLREPMPNGKRGGKEDVIGIPALWSDIDIRGENHKQPNLPGTLDEAVELAYSLPWDPSLVVFSGGGIQTYWIFEEVWVFGCDSERERAAQLSKRFQAFVIAEGARRGWRIDDTADLARVLRVPGTFNRKHTPVPVEVIEYHPDRRYSPSDFEEYLPADVEEPKHEPGPVHAPAGGRPGDVFNANAKWDDILIPAGWALEKEREGVKYWIRPGKDSGRGATTNYGGSDLFYCFTTSASPFEERHSYNKFAVYSLLNHGGDFKAAARALAEAGYGEDTLQTSDPSHTEAMERWPEMCTEAFHGLAGAVVEAIDPYTEADKKAVLLHFLAAFGNVVGDGPHIVVGADRHPARINGVLVGQSSKGRKGTAWSPIREILRLCDGPWAGDRIRSGLSTGEGIIYHLRDSDGKDEGVCDKRLFVIEAEFSSMLKIMSREGNSLSGVIRQAWDHGDLSTLTKNSPLKATGAHFSVVGHTTSEELLRYMDATERGNGFANRILWCLVRRSKLVPDGDVIPLSTLQDLANRVGSCISWTRNVESMRRDRLASELWREVYGSLSEPRPGLSGAILNRSEAQVLRLSLIYALLDRSPEIRVPHLQAALAVWDCCEESVLSIFGDRTGDPVADRIIDELRGKGVLTREEISALFSRHRLDDIDRALVMLERIGRITTEVRPTGGRPVTIFQVAKKAI